MKTKTIKTARTNDYIERIQAEYVTKQFNMMMSQYPILEQLSSMLPVGEFLNANGMLLDGNVPSARPLVMINPSVLDKQHLNQSQMNKLSNDFDENDSVETDSMMNQPYVCINLHYREQLAPHTTHLSHSIINITPLFGLSDSFNTSEDDLIDAQIYIGHANNGMKQALLYAHSEDGFKYYVELSDFCMLSLVEKDDNKEKAIFTVFNRQLGILYSEYIEGSPTSKTATLPLPSSTTETDEATPTPTGDNNTDVKS